MNQFRRKVNVLFVIIGIMVAGIVWPQGAKAVEITLEGTPPFKIMRTDGGYEVTLNGNTLTVSTDNPVYVANRENETETILSCGQKVRVIPFAKINLPNKPILASIAN